MTTHVNPKLWAGRLESAGVPSEVIEALTLRYSLVPLGLVTALIEDDRQCGIGPATFGRSPDCARHDAQMLCAKFGYPVVTPEESALDLLSKSTELGAKGLRDFALWPFKVLIGAPVGWVMDRWRGR